MTETKFGNRIYYYCKLDTAIEHILPNMQLRLSPLNNTNDPRENKPFNFTHDYRLSHRHGDHEEADAEISEELRKGVKVLCFSRETKTKESFGFELTTMWAHYGGRHTGVCIELGKKEFIDQNRQKIKEGLFKNIKYQKFYFQNLQEHPVIDFKQIDKIGKEKYVDQFRMKHRDHFFFTKDYDWRSEYETRLVYFSNNLNEEYCKIDQSIKNIYLGVDFNPGYIPSILKLCKEADVYQLYYYEGRLLKKEKLA